ncbi:MULTISPECIES: hypothetical protein [unclassified Chryseobacterium]|uniref:hypothetical protein n=1 Tax=unclassified Chryseobacterium TaxID=2593645 RepID=UPI0030183ACA
MDIQELIFQTVSDHSHLWIKYYKLTEYKAMSSPGEYITIRASFIGSETINRILAEGFVIETIQSKKLTQTLILTCI